MTRWQGVRSVTASSSASDAGATLRLGPGTGPAAALDGDPLTRWVSGVYGEAVGQWLELGLSASQRSSGLTIQLSGGYPIQAQPTRVRVSTDTGSVTSDILETDTVVALATPPGMTTRLRVELDAVASGAPNGFGIAELAVPGVHPVPELVMPATGPAAPAQILSRVEVPALAGCAFVATRSLCSPTLVRAGEENAGIFRSLTLAAGAAPTNCPAPSFPAWGAISNDCWTSLAGSPPRPAVAASRARLRGRRQSPTPTWAPGGWPAMPIRARDCDSTSRRFAR